MSAQTVTTTPFEGQKPGTSGLRKKTKVFIQQHYLENFIQSTFNALPSDKFKGTTLVVAGDGRYYNKQAIATIVKMAAANGFGKVVTGVNGLMSTPCVSDCIRKLGAFGGIILTASHNPGGIDEDFGVKYNCENGGPAPEKITGLIYENTTKITEYKIWSEDCQMNISATGAYSCGPMTVEVIDAAAMYVELCKSIFDFEALKKFVSRDDFSLLYDSMHGVAGPFANEIFIKELGLSESSLVNCVPKEDFGGGHPDPNLTYAHDLVEAMGMDPKHPQPADKQLPAFGAAADGDADRNMILGDRFFVTPSDSVAVIAAYAQAAIPYFKAGLKGVARSMPTSAALDRVAQKNGFNCYEVPTGWKFFGNLMDAGKLSICGEESFGTGSDHIREKDGVWAVLCWLSILEYANRDSSDKLVTVKDIVTKHWTEYGRNYYSRYDYENCESGGAKQLMAHLVSLTEKYTQEGNTKLGEYTIATADEFCYTDPVDGSVSAHQGIRFIFTDGSRIIFRLSGTGSVGATIRLYVEQYDDQKLEEETQTAVKPLIDLALELSKMEEFTGRKEPTVIT